MGEKVIMLSNTDRILSVVFGCLLIFTLWTHIASCHNYRMAIKERDNYIQMLKKQMLVTGNTKVQFGNGEGPHFIMEELND